MVPYTDVMVWARIALWVLCGSAGFWQTPQITAPASVYPGDPPEFVLAKSLAAEAKRKLPEGISYRKLILNRFALASELRTALQSGTHPIYAEGKTLGTSIQLCLKELKAYDDDGLRYVADLNAYNSEP